MLTYKSGRRNTRLCGGETEAEVEVALDTLYYAKQVNVDHERVVSVRDGWTTTAKYEKSYMHTRLTKIVPGVEIFFAIDGHEFNVKIPKQGDKAKCIVWGDPCKVPSLLAVPLVSFLMHMKSL